MPKIAKAELKLISGADMYLSFEKVWEAESVTFLRDVDHIINMVIGCLSIF